MIHNLYHLSTFSRLPESLSTTKDQFLRDLLFHHKFLSIARILQMVALGEYTWAILVCHIMSASKRLFQCADQASGTEQHAVSSVIQNSED